MIKNSSFIKAMNEESLCHPSSSIFMIWIIKQNSHIKQTCYQFQTVIFLFKLYAKKIAYLDTQMLNVS